MHIFPMIFIKKEQFDMIKLQMLKNVIIAFTEKLISPYVSVYSLLRLFLSVTLIKINLIKR